MPSPTAKDERSAPGWTRGIEFWSRASSIYFSYKFTQLRAAVAAGLLHKTASEVKEEIWAPQHEWAGDKMWELCTGLRGFYLKAGQFIGSRGDFVPEQICRKLALLCDKVPPMPEAKARQVLHQELGISDLGEVFEWIDLTNPVGSASISQVHKAKLRSFSSSELRAAGRTLRDKPGTHVVAPGQSVWDVCNLHAVSLQELKVLNKDLKSGRALVPGEVLQIPTLQGLSFLSSPTSSESPSLPSSSSSSSKPALRWGATPAAPMSGAAAAVLHATASGSAPSDGLVAVKIQYPDALAIMSGDLGNLRGAAYFLSKTEIAFDLVSAVDELNRQIKFEFDFIREARVQDTLAETLKDIRHHVSIPRSVPGLVTKRLLVMRFMEGTPLLDAHKHLKKLSEWQRMQGSKRILSRISEAYGRMMLGTGLFQADGHPGNIMVQQGGRVALLDYGQSKQLPDELRLQFARLVLRLHKGSKTDVRSHPGISAVLADMGVKTAQDNHTLRADMAYGMFDTIGKADPFDPDSPLKKCAIESFPPDLFFVLRVVQLLRGMANGMGIKDYSCTDQWTPHARDALRRAGLKP